MKNRPNNISVLLTLFLMIAVLLVFFLPAAISMNTSTDEKTIPDINSSVYHSGSWDGIPLQNGVQTSSLKNEKGSLSLRTAAIVGSSAVDAAAALIGSRNAIFTD